MSVLVLFALEREAGPFRRLRIPGVAVAVSGVGATASLATLERIAPSRVVAAGFCGALSATLRAGDVVWPTEVCDESGQLWPVEPSAKASQPPTTNENRLLTAGRLIGDPTEKAALATRHSAAIVDMESAAVAAWCARRRVPFACCRAVSDDAATRLSPRLLRLLARGKPTVGRILSQIAVAPSLVPEMIRLARDTARAARNLATALVPALRSA